MRMLSHLLAISLVGLLAQATSADANMKWDRGGAQAVFRASLSAQHNVMRADSNMDPQLVPNTSGNTTYACTSRISYVSQHAFSEAIIQVPLWTGSTTAPITEVAFPEAYDFAAALEYPYYRGVTGVPTASRTQAVPVGQSDVVFHYKPGGQALPYVQFYIKLGYTVPALTPYGILLTSEHVGGRTAAVTSKGFFQGILGSNYLNRNMGFGCLNSPGGGSGVGEIATNAVMTRTGFSSSLLNSQTGGVVPMSAGALLIPLPVQEKSIGINGNSIEAGSNEGNQNSMVPSSVFTASQSGTTLTVTALQSGTIAVGQYVTGPSYLGYPSPAARNQITALGTGTGGVGTYTMSASITAASNQAWSGTPAGDSWGDFAGNHGWAMRMLASKGIAMAQRSRGSDRDSYRKLAGAVAFRNQWAASLNLTGDIDLNAHNEIANGTSTTLNYAGSPSHAYAVDDTVYSNGNEYICDGAGTSNASGLTGPSGTGYKVQDPSGTTGLLWTYLGPRDMTTNSDYGATWVAQKRVVQRLYQAAMPGVNLIGVTTPPTSTSVQTVADANVAYNSTSGVLTLTTSPIGYTAGYPLLISGYATGFDGYWPVQATTGTTVSVQIGTGLTKTGAAMNVTPGWTVASVQTSSSGYGANSQRSWINRYLRNPPWPTLAYVGVIDLAKFTEVGAPTTLAAETNAWRALTDATGTSVPFSTSDGTHPSSAMYLDAATQAANDNGVDAALRLRAR